MSGSATIEITALGQASITSYSISPKKLNLTGTTSGNKLTFTVSGDEYLIVKINGGRALVIAADPAETNKPASSGTGIYNVKSSPYNADSTGAGMATTAIQNAINDAANYTGGQGIVYVPAGIYKAGNLQLKSDVVLYLEGGAVLRFTGVASDYTVNWHKDSQNRDVTWWLYTQTGADNLKIYGRGTIDGNGKYATTTNNFASNIIVPIGTTNFTLDGPLIRDSGSWAVTPARSNDLTFKNMKIFNRFDMGENDGIDVNESQNVLVQHGIGIGLDDPYTTKTWDQTVDISLSWPGSPEPVSNVVFDDLFSWTVCFGFKVGQVMRQNQSDVTFKNSVVYDSSVGIGVDHKYGVGTLTNVTFDNIDIERVTNTNDSTRTWAYFII
jgi:polygalacturonase